MPDILSKQTEVFTDNGLYIWNVCWLWYQKDWLC